MTEQQIREQTQAVFDAYLMISRNGISLSDFLEIRREAIQELDASRKAEDAGTEKVNNAPHIKENQKKKPQEEAAEAAGDSGMVKDDRNQFHGKLSSAETTKESITAKTASKETAMIEHKDEEIAEAVINDSDGTSDEYSDFLDGFEDPWN